MKRRFLLVGLIIALPLGVGWWAKRVADRRPVAMGQLPALSKVAAMYADGEYLNASSQRVLCIRMSHLPGTSSSYNGGLQTYGTLFDLDSGRVKSFFWPSQRQFTGLEGEAVWGLCQGKDKHSGYVEIEIGGKTKKFSFESPDFEFELLGDEQSVLFRVFPAQNRAVLLCLNRVYSWNLQTTRLEKNIQFEEPRRVDPRTVLSRDARTFIHYVGGLRIGDVRSGKTQKWVVFPNSKLSESLYLSPYGRTILFENTKSSQIQVVDATNGKSLWKFANPLSGASHSFNTVNSNQIRDWAISGDEETIFVHRDDVWEVRDLKTGMVRSSLPWISGTTAVVASPEGGTLYSVARGVLYRQRAR